jgi:hypothetical protein
MENNWDHILDISRFITSEYGDAVFIGGVAVSCHASRLGSRFQESSHDGDFYISLMGKAAMRDRYEVRRNNTNIIKDSVLIEGEELDVYVEHQHSLGIQFPEIFAASEVIEGIRVAALEHLLILKLDAAKDRWGTGKGEKDVRDLARIVALLDRPKHVLLAPFLSPIRMETLGRALGRSDLVQLMGLNPHEGSKFRAQLDSNLKNISRGGQAPPQSPPPAPPSPSPPPTPSFGGRRR